MSFIYRETEAEALPVHPPVVFSSILGRKTRSRMGIQYSRLLFYLMCDMTSIPGRYLFMERTLILGNPIVDVSHSFDALNLSLFVRPFIFNANEQL